MKRKLSWLSTAAITFIIGVGSVAVWFQVPNSPIAIQQGPAATIPRRGSQRMHVCLTRFDINLGDSFDYVNGQIELAPDPNGPNENIEWVPGKLTDFFTINAAPIELDKDNQLNPSIFCTFDSRQTLQSFTISWALNGEKSNSIKRKFLNALLEGERSCMKATHIDLGKSTYKQKTDVGEYIEEFSYDFGAEPYWSVSYSVTLKR